jgi:hypothetical protein
MTRPGPKPANLHELKQLAAMFTHVFLDLRDGREGYIFRLEQVPMAEARDGQFMRLAEIRALTGEDGQILNAGGELLAKIVPAKTKDEREIRRLLSQLQGDPRRIWIEQPVFPRRDLWEALKHADSVAEMRDVTKHIARWMRCCAHPRWRRELQSHAVDLFRAKKMLWNYPRSDRPSSDNRRAEFFGKALAGLILGVSPATAARQLSRRSPRKPPQPPPPPIRARGPDCPHCGAQEVQGFPSGTVVRCPRCDQRYYIARKREAEQKKLRTPNVAS